MKKLPPLPKTTKNENKVLVQAEINKDFWSLIEREMDSLGLTKRQVVEFGLKAFLLKTNPKEAHKLGIEEEKE